MGIEWMEPYMVYFDRLATSIRKLCFIMGIGHLADDVIGETFLQICEKADKYNPGRSSFVTWVIENAKDISRQMVSPSQHERYGGDKSHGIHLRYEHMFAECGMPEFSDEGNTLFAVEHKFEDPFDLPGTKIKPFLDSLTDSERACLTLLLRDGKVRYRQLGQLLGVSHVHAGKLLPGIMESLQEKAERLR